jgi:hypothetical protein
MKTMGEDQCHCPLCLEPVVKVTESDRVVKNNVKCESEYFIHYDDKLIKIKNPKDVPISEANQA